MSCRMLGKARLVVAFLVCASPGGAAETADPTAAATALALSYPDVIVAASAETIQWRDGSITRFGDVRSRGAIDAIMRAPSLGEQFLFAYPLRAWSAAELPVSDPGRIRNQEFFTKIYGDCR